jgi:sortase A
LLENLCNFSRSLEVSGSVVRSVIASTALLLAAAGSLAACGSASTAADRPADEHPVATQRAPITSTQPPETPRNEPAAAPAPPPEYSDGRPRRARLSIPALGLHDLLIVPYRGRTDDAPGTRIQDNGAAASPFGPQGGVGPGGLGNYQVTGHRTSSTHPFAELPSLRLGARAVVVAGGVRYVYEIRQTRQTSFRSPRSLAEQRAAVPGRPRATPTHAYLTLSTCATQEDHAAGNYWSDALHNPEHRIDKIGVLVRTVVDN